jgi:hypothetical protein
MRWGFFVLTVLAGVWFYWLRYKYRIVYGILEVMIAVVLMIVTIFPSQTYNLLTQGPTTSDIFISWMTRVATMFGAVCVRARVRQHRHGFTVINMARKMALGETNSSATAQEPLSATRAQRQ